MMEIVLMLFYYHFCDGYKVYYNWIDKRLLFLLCILVMYSLCIYCFFCHSLFNSSCTIIPSLIYYFSYEFFCIFIIIMFCFYVYFPGILQSTLGSPGNNQQIYTEQLLESNLASGTIDIGFFYQNEQVWTAGNIRFISLPSHLNMGNFSLNSYYKKVSIIYCWKM